MNNAGYSQMGLNPNQMGAQYNMNMNYGNNNAMNFGQQQPNMNQNQSKKDLLDDLF